VKELLDRLKVITVELIKMKCECDGEMKREKVEVFRGMLSEGYKCQKCGALDFHRRAT